jgi:hypothetical protein
MSLDRQRQMIEPAQPQLSVVRRCELVSTAGRDSTTGLRAVRGMPRTRGTWS